MRHVMAFAARRWTTRCACRWIRAPAAEQKMTPEELVKLHLQALTAGVAVPREQARDVKGAVAAIDAGEGRGPAAGNVPPDAPAPPARG